jgi:phage gpG-like protein
MIAAVHELGAVVDIPAMQQSRKNGMMHVGEKRQVTIPARPVSLLGERSEARIMDVIDLMIDQIQAQAVGR